MAISGETEGGMPPEGGAPDMGGAPPLGGDMGAAPVGDMGGAPPLGGGAPLGGGVGAAPMMEGMSEEAYEKHLEKLVFGTTKEPEQKKNARQKEIIQENNDINDKLNKGAADMVAEIETLLENSESINSEQKIDEAEDIDIEDIENIDLDD